MWSGTTDAEIVREYGHRLIDRITEYLEGIAELPLSPSPEQMHEVADHLAGPLPRKGRDADEVWAEFWEVIARRSIHLRNPLYMGHQVAPPLPHAALAELVIGLFKDRKSTRLNSSHVAISYAVFCLKNKTETQTRIDGSDSA